MSIIDFIIRCSCGKDGGLKVPIPEPVEDDSQKMQGGNGQENQEDQGV